MLDKLAFGQRVMTARNDRKMTQDQLGERCGVSSFHIRQIEAGNKSPSISLLLEVCNELKVSPAYLLQDSLSLGYPDVYDKLKRDMLDLPPSRVEYAISMLELIKKTLK